MATERQIAANRTNACKSTGPKTKAGKRRAAANAFRHGLSVKTDDGDNSDDLELLVRQIVGDATNQELHHYARIAACAHLDLVRIRQIKADIFKRVFESNDSSQSLFRLRPLLAEREHLNFTCSTQVRIFGSTRQRPR